ncbi:hypothetical protein EV129_113114 [Rhizobium azibense]|uniref:DUF1643 domain-containing protein n=2 Tax=Rhizobium azibense TaxID=1136135 RepID=A0A4R3RF08_9HYPH|nr:hypothetical protein EV129_113114 [Rhizobium azibense]
MSDLFMRRSAIISICKMYRYELRRIWDDRLPLLVVCMLNPSLADDQVEDPTLRELIHFAKMWGYGGLLIVNFYAFRSPSPKEMFAQGCKAFGPENDAYIKGAIAYARNHGGKLLAAWGNDGHVGGYHMYFTTLAAEQKVDLVCLGKTNSGQPKHPMARGKHRIPRSQMPIIWKEAAL